jgi:hypothetical protein
MSLKTIKVNPIFLSGSGSSSSFGPKNKTRKEKPNGVSLNQSNSIKKKLIARIKNFQQKGNKSPSQVNEQPLNDAFGESVQFLDNLARDKEELKSEKKNKTLKNKPTINPYINIATELPPELDWNTITPRPIQQQAQQVQAQQQAQQVQAQPIQQVQAQQQAQQPIQQPLAPIQQPLAPIQQPLAQVQQPPIQQWTASPQPLYSNLKKGGTKPTYRTWLRTTQKQKPVPKQSINILEDIGEPMSEHIKAEHIEAEPIKADEPIKAEPIAPPPVYTPSHKPRRKRITRTLKYKLGKHANGTVSVLIKNSQTRRKVQTEQALLKQKSILEIKNHLRSNNLLKVGSNAPSDVLRHLFEQSILAGQIENKAKDTLIHNYFNEEKH